jgi:methionyl-tRNA formyltransferase
VKNALIGSVSSSYAALEAMIRNGIELCGVLGLDESAAERVSDYRSLRELAESAAIPFHSFTSVRDRAVEMFLRAHRPDLLWVIGLSQLVPDTLIRLARDGGIGFHPTMLPKGRGRTPVAWTILLNEPAAVSLFFLTNEPDAGDIIVQREVPVRPHDYAADLIERTNQALGQVITELSPLIRIGALPRIPQDHRKATYYERRSPDDGRIDWSQTTDRAYRLIRAAGRPYPGAFTNWEDSLITVWRARPATPFETDAVPHYPAFGSVLSINGDGHVLVRTGDGGLWLTEFERRDVGGRIQPPVGSLLGAARQTPVRKTANAFRPGRRTASR